MFENSTSRKKILVAVGYFVLVELITAYLIYNLTFWINAAFKVQSFFVVLGTVGGFSLIVAGTGIKNLIAKSKVATILSGIFNTFFVLLAVCSIILELARLIAFIFIQSSYVRGILYFAAGVGALASTVIIFIIGIIRTKMLKTVTYNIVCKENKGKLVKKQMEEYKIVLISDTHIGFYVGPKHISRIVSRISEQCPDLIVIAGDIMNSPDMTQCKKLSETARILRQLRAVDGVYGVTGNHDPQGDDSKFSAFLQDANITLLDDEAKDLDKFVLVGRKSVLKKGTRKNLDEICLTQKPIIVVDHDPKAIDDAAGAGAFSVLCGHTHKGQAWPFNYFTRMQHRSFRFWGADDRHGTVSVVTSGAGIFGVPLRVGSSNEIVVLNIKFLL